MMPQIPAFAPNEQIIAQREFNQYIFAQANAIAPESPIDSFNNLARASQDILTHALMLAQQKEHLSKKEYKKLLNQYGWKHEDRKYLKVAEAFKHFTSEDLAKIEPATLFRLANNPKKYQSIIDQLLSAPEINQQTVRDLIALSQHPTEPKPEQPSIWRRTRDGRRYCQIPPIHETDDTALAVKRFAYRTGTTLQKMMDEEGLTAQSIVAEAIALRQAYKEGRLVLAEQEAAPEVTPEYGDEIEQELPEEPALEKDDATQSEQVMSSVSLSPQEELIEAFQNATTWEQIREALAVREEHKQEAWEALTPVEQKRVKGLMPQTVKKLFEAKKAGLIFDFQELREGVYRVQRMGDVLAVIVNALRLDAFLAHLRGDGQSFA